MTVDTVPTFVTALRRLRLLTFEQLDLCARELEAHFPEPRTLALDLVQRGWLTPHQVNELFLGRGEQLLLGSYVILDKLGEGGMGTVYKARNWKLDKIVALKVIKRDRLVKPKVIKRFYREIRAAAQLDHPNIVRAFDADEVAGTHFFVMEFVEGTDLHQLVKKQGPLPIWEACEYIRQAALGLQHAFERGLVHRDIKPHNLLLASGGCKPPMSSPDSDTGGLRPPLAVVKVLDMGLALVESPTHDDDRSGTMTQSGIVMGTPDYMAPEQSRNAHTVDIRADLYSLGCTLFFLLTGRAPFAGGSLTEKLLKHQVDLPDSVKKIRPDVPVEVDVLVHQLLAKRPEVRPQTPRELAQALDTLLTNLSEKTPTTTIVPVATTPTNIASETDVVVQEAWARIVPPVAPGERPQAALSRLLVPMLAVLGVILATAGGIWWATRPGQEKPERVEKPLPPPKPPEKDGPPPRREPVLPSGPATEEWIELVRKLPAEEQVRAVFAKLKELNAGFDPQDPSNSFEVKDGTVVVLKMEHPITDITPVRALAHLRNLEVAGGVGSESRGPSIVSLADLSPLKGLPLRRLAVPGQRLGDLTPLSGMPLETLDISTSLVSDLSPLRNCVHLTSLSIKRTDVSDLTPLKGLKLQGFQAQDAPIEDITPLQGMPLSSVNLSGSRVRDLTPLQNAPLVSLHLSGAPVHDLTPILGAKLTHLEVDETLVESLEPLRLLSSLTTLACTFHPGRDTEVLSSIKSLKTINDQPASRFWKIVRLGLEHEHFVKQTQALPPGKQVEAVCDRLAVLNEGVRYRADHEATDGSVVGLRLTLEPRTEVSKTLGDFTPLAVFKKLRSLEFVQPSGTSFQNLEPLRGLPLEKLHLEWARVRDLSPLIGMPLRSLEISTRSPTLKALDGMLLRHLVCKKSTIYDIAALRRASLERFDSPFVRVHDLESLRGQPLKHINLNFIEPRHGKALREMKTLETINGKKPDDFWKDIAEQQVEFVRRELKRLTPTFDGELTPKIEQGKVVELLINSDQNYDLTPVRALPDLQSLVLYPKSKKADHVPQLKPLTGLPLKQFACYYLPLKDLSPLQGMPLTSLFLHDVEVEDLSPLQGMLLRTLVVNSIKTYDLTPIRNMPLERFEGTACTRTGLNILKSMPLTELVIDFDYYRDSELLRGMMTLQRINKKNVVEFWKIVEEQQVKFEKWSASVAEQSPKDQVQAVSDELKKRNASFDGVLTWKEGIAGQVDSVKIVVDRVTDITPLRAFPKMRSLSCAGSEADKGKLVFLAPLKGLPLTTLEIAHTPVADLSPLEGMPLKSFLAFYTHIEDFNPLRKLPLEEFNLIARKDVDFSFLKDMKLRGATLGGKFNDLALLADMPLQRLFLSNVSDLRPLKPLTKLNSLQLSGKVKNLNGIEELPITWLYLHGLKIEDPSLLAKMPLVTLGIDYVPEKHQTLLRSIKTLKIVNGKPASEFLK